MTDTAEDRIRTAADTVRDYAIEYRAQYGVEVTTPVSVNDLDELLNELDAWRHTVLDALARAHPPAVIEEEGPH